MKPLPVSRIHAKRILFILTFITAAVIFYLYNLNTPLYADDYSYSFSFSDGTRIDSVADIFPSLQAHYHSMNGRLVTHFFAHLHLMLGKNIFNLINTCIFMGLGLLMYRISGFGWKDPRPGALGLIFALLYSETPDFSESFLWVTASATYLLGVVIILLFFLPYWEVFRCPHKPPAARPRSCVLAIGNFVFGFLAGAASENVSLAMLAMLAVIIVMLGVQKKLRIWMLPGFTGSIAGYLFMLSAPGNGQRMSSFGSQASLFHYFNNFKLITIHLTVYLRFLLLIGLILFCSYLFMKRTAPFQKIILESLPLFVLLMGTAASLYSMIVVDYFPLRVWSGTTILGIISCLYLFGQVKWSSRIAKSASHLVLAVIIASTLYKSIGTIRVLREEMSAYNARVESIQAQIRDGNDDIYIPRLTGHSKFSCFWEENSDIIEDSSHWTNTGIARYWGVRSINMIP